MAWNGSVLTVGGQRGTIRHFDTRIKETAKMKEQSKRVTRHQAQICSLAWHGEGKFFASGDESGIVHVWDSRQNAPILYFLPRDRLNGVHGNQRSLQVAIPHLTVLARSV